MVSNTYRLEYKEFKVTHWHPLFDAYERCLDGGVLYSNAHELIDSMAVNFKANMDTVSTRKGSERMVEEFGQKLITHLQAFDDTDAFLDSYKSENLLPSDMEMEYAFVFRRIGIMVSDSTEINIFKDEEGQALLGSLEEVNPQNNIMDMRTVVRGNTLLSYSFHVDTPSRKSLLLKQMGGLFALSFISIAVTLSALLYTIYNWQRQKKLSDMKSDFINNMNHELKTPLTTVLVANSGLKQLMQSDLQEEKNEKQAKRFVNVIDRQTKRLQGLIDQVLDLSFMGKQGLQLHLEPIPLNALSAAIIKDLELRYKEQECLIQFSDTASEDLSMVDLFHFTTVINNLVDNGIKYSHSPAKILVRTYNPDNAHICIAVRDEGIGISTKEKAAVFGKFYRSEQAAEHGGKGLGLGLHFVKQIIDAHQASIRLESEVDKGSCFTLTFKIHTDHPK